MRTVSYKSMKNLLKSKEGRRVLTKAVADMSSTSLKNFLKASDTPKDFKGLAYAERMRRRRHAQ